MAWGKKLIVSIGDPANPFVAEFSASDLSGLGPVGLSEATTGTANGDAIEVQNLTVGFRVVQSNVFNENRAEINIANISPETAAKFIAAGNSNITIEAGYDDEGTDLIFSGFVISAVGQWEKADHYLNIVAKTIRAKGYAGDDNKVHTVSTKGKRKGEIVATDVGLPIRVVLGRERRKVVSRTFVSFSYAPDSKLLDIAKALSANLGVVLNVFNESEVSTFKRPNGYNYSGRVSGVIKDLKQFFEVEGYGMTMNLSEINIYKLRDTGSTLDVPALSYDTGLLRVGPVQNYEIDKDQVESFPPKSVWEIESILNPKLKANSIVQIKSDQLDGFFLIENVQHHGDTAGGAFNSTLIVSRQ